MPFDYTMAKVPLCPEKAVVRASPGQRALGRLLHTDMPLKDVPKDPSGVDLVGDTFFSLYQTEPKLKEEVDPERAINQALIKWLIEDDKFPTTSASTRHNIAASSVSAGIVATTLLQDENVKKALKKQEQAEEHRQMEAQAIQDMANALKEGQNDIAEACSKRAEEEHKKAEAAAAEGVGNIEKMKRHPIGQQVMAIAQKKGKEKGDQVASFMRGWGIEPSSLDVQDASKIVSYANTLDLNELVEKLGRYEGITLQSIESHRKNRAGVASEVDMTRDFTKLFPSESAYLSPNAPSVMRTMKLLSFAEHGALGWKPVNEGEKNGSFLAYVDRSGSMHGEHDHTAKAINLAVARAFLTLGGERKYVIKSFDTEIGTFENGKAVSSDMDWKAHIQWAQSGTGGGTDFDLAMEDFIKSIKDLPEDEDHIYDLLFTSDGQAMMRPATLSHLKELMETRHVRLFYIEIKPSWGGSGYNHQLADMATGFAYVEGDMSQSGAADKIAQQIGEMFAKM